MNGLRIAVILLVLATAIIHFQLNFPDPVFILNGLGYLGLLAALYLPIPQFENYRSVVRWVLICFTALTILLWVLIGARSLIGYVDKTIEIVLIALLLVEAGSLRRRVMPPTARS